MNPTQTQALHAILLAVLEAVQVGGSTGTASGILYAAMLPHGATMHQYQSFMSAIVAMGFVSREGEAYFITSLGEQRLMAAAPALAD